MVQCLNLIQSFNGESAYVYVPTDATYRDVRQQLNPLLENMDTFDALASQKKYTTNIKAGRFLINKGMSNNDIINSIRSKNVPFQLAFNNQNSLAALAGRISEEIEADSLSLYNAMTDNFIFKRKRIYKGYRFKYVSTQQL